MLTDIRPGNRVLHNESGVTSTVIRINNENIESKSLTDNIHCVTAEISGIQLTIYIYFKTAFFKQHRAG